MVLVLIAAVVITPTRDVFNMLLVAMPLYTLLKLACCWRGSWSNRWPAEPRRLVAAEMKTDGR